DFSVTLRFSGTPARVVVPWEVLTAFADPSVPFGLRLSAEPEVETGLAAQAEPAAEAQPPADAASPANVIAFRRQKPRE
ncbi:MAG TPA: ClpXP protease specificity-enhancing factor SspB, partial [Vicinamibacteria bacterium]|nr:ClpXP protease specificity-enhancing factor SspB [Vicinamibacteria bacterium]